MLRTAVLAALALALAVPGSAAAQPASTTLEPRAPVAAPYDPTVALALSLGATAVGYGVLYAGVDRRSDGLTAVGLAGIGLGPSIGHWYSGHVLTRGLGFRVVGAATAAAGALVMVSSCPIFETEKTHCGAETLAVILGLSGAGLFVAGTLDDIFTAPGEARRRNQRRLAVAPVVTPDRAGLAVMGTF